MCVLCWCGYAICILLTILNLYLGFHSGIDHIRKIHGHEVKDDADPEIAVTKYSHLFKTTFDPLYDTLEGVTFKFNEDESLLVVNRMFQVLVLYIIIIMLYLT